MRFVDAFIIYQKRASCKYNDRTPQERVTSQYEDLTLALVDVGKSRGGEGRSPLNWAIAPSELYYSPARERFGNYVPTIVPQRYDAFIFISETTALNPLH